MKRLIVLIIAVSLLCGCKVKAKHQDEQYIKVSDYIYIASPSGFIYIASGSDVIPYIKNGKVMNISDYMEAQK